VKAVLWAGVAACTVTAAAGVALVVAAVRRLIAAEAGQSVAGWLIVAAVAFLLVWLAGSVLTAPLTP
jgi:hypothetical protein